VQLGAVAGVGVGAGDLLEERQELLVSVAGFDRAGDLDPPRVLWRLMTRKDLDQPALRKYPDELKERATRLALDARRDARTRRGAIARIAGRLDIHPEALQGVGAVG
jgi:hypothetical protein